ncbi:hypothetical protein JTE90_008946 [Oedothorax gibbosus]|uniref:Uncharacterized protein n=1 Tax=Oedothorax gibbosus TaxID=931172 RepID=A0AAV6UN56_9ARAC|nr:hypothetical protein JTE90_008946 [Oedothorax gibbosus]
MGCGGSRASRLVSPLSKAVISWNGAAPQPTALQLKERLRLLATKDASVQIVWIKFTVITQEYGYKPCNFDARSSKEANA